MKKGFTLIEMLVVIAIISIVAGVIIVGINPAKRIADAQDSRARQDVRSVASAAEACLSYADPTAGTINTTANCDTAAELTGAVIPGAPFARAIPSNVNFAVSGTTICINEAGSGTGATTNWWKYTTATGQVAVQVAAAATCP